MSLKKKIQTGIKIARMPHNKMEGLRKKGRKFKKAEDEIFKRFKKDFPNFK